jgi:hypothetical protein
LYWKKGRMAMHLSTTGEFALLWFDREPHHATVDKLHDS